LAMEKLYQGKWIKYVGRLSQPALGCLKVHCHTRVLEHSMQGRYHSPSSLYGYHSGDWSG
jgi:hypothetical protein